MSRVAARLQGSARAGGPAARSVRRPVLALLAACYALLAVAWVFGNPPGAAPDEGDHYLRALAVAGGDLRGRPNPELAGQPKSLPKRAGAPALADLWLKKGARVVTVPPGLLPVEWGCDAFNSADDASCLLDHPSPSGSVQATTNVGTVEPGLYVLPGLAARLGGGPASALRLGRLVDAAIMVALLATAAALLWPSGGSPLRLAGLLVAVTPMVVFTGSVLSPSGPEIAAGICFFSALLALAGGQRRPLAWAGAGVSGAVLALSRSLGPVWIVLMAAIVVAYRGWRPCWAAVRDGRTYAIVAATAIAVTTASTVFWERAFQPGIEIDGSYFWHEVSVTFGTLVAILRDLVGHFGWLDTPLPNAAHAVWAAMLAGLVGLAAALGDGRRRIVLAVLPALVVLVIVLVSAGLLRQNGFELQGRHVLAFAAAVPLLAADIVAERARGGRTKRAGRPEPPLRLLPALAVPALAVQAVAWYDNARRYAVGTNGPIWFAGHAKWSPPGTWSLWALVVILAVAAGVAAAWLASRRPSEATVYASPA